MSPDCSGCCAPLRCRRTGHRRRGESRARGQDYLELDKNSWPLLEDPEQLLLVTGTYVEAALTDNNTQIVAFVFDVGRVAGAAGAIAGTAAMRCGGRAPLGAGRSAAISRRLGAYPRGNMTEQML